MEVEYTLGEIALPIPATRYSQLYPDCPVIPKLKEAGRDNYNLMGNYIENFKDETEADQSCNANEEELLALIDSM